MYGYTRAYIIQQQTYEINKYIPMHFSYMQMNALQRAPGMLTNTIPAHCSALPTHSRYELTHSQHTSSALQGTSHMQMSALPGHFFFI